MTGFNYGTTTESITTLNHTGSILGLIDDRLVLAWTHVETGNSFYDLANPREPNDDDDEEVAYEIVHMGQRYFVTGEDSLCTSEAEAVDYIHHQGGFLIGESAAPRPTTESDHFL